MSLIDRVLEQRLERAEARHLVEDFGDEGVELVGVERQPLDHDVLRDQLLDVRAHLVFRQLLQRREVDLLDQPAVQPHLGVEQLVAEQRIVRRGRRLVARPARARPTTPARPRSARLDRRPAAVAGGGGSGAGVGSGSQAAESAGHARSLRFGPCSLRPATG